MKKILYLCSEYPALSHTFIDKEIDALENKKFKIYTASINYPKNTDKFSKDYKERLEKTYYIKREKKINIVKILLVYMLSKPLVFMKAFLRAYNLSYKKGVKNFKKFIGYFVESTLLHNYMVKNKIEHVHIHFANPASTVALIAKTFGNIEYSISVHGPDEFYNTNENLISEKVEEAKFIRTISHFCTSQLMRESRPENWSKFNIVRCGIDLKQFREKEKKEEEKIINIVCVGRLTPSKGQNILVDAIENISKVNKNFKLTLIGGGEDYEYIKEKIKSKNLSSFIDLRGPVAHEVVRDSLGNADIFVLPSFAEGIPVALMEAMAMKIPVISTKINGIPELIEHGKNGFLVEASNEESLRKILIDLLNRKIDLDEIKKNARKRIEENYNIEKNILGMCELFLENI